MKGFNTSDGYMGFVEDRYILFASEMTSLFLGNTRTQGNTTMTRIP